ncbi:MAG: hypothetical protein KAJ75_00085 [Alphaproteobacteria bacterium]|nr:hypothetical protein [Alphaproteobacteria bacterium]
MARARRVSKVIDFPEEATAEEVEDAVNPYLNDGWSLIEVWTAGGKTYILLVKVLTN